MAIFSPVALLLVAAIIANRNKSELSVSLPVTTGGLILVLYILAFFRSLTWIDTIGLLFIAGLIVVSVTKKYPVGKTLKSMITPVNLVIGVSLIVLTVSQKAVMASWWDDLNYWATDAKALYYLNGFPGKYGNVAPEFGDYPPALSLFKWYFMHFSSTYIEGLGYSAYQCLNFILMLPLLSSLGKGKWKYTPLYMLGCGIIYYLPSVCNVVSYEGACADVTMALLYGNMLWCIWQLAQSYKLGDDNKDRKLLIAGIAVYSTVLVLTKSVGVEWVAYAFIFFLIMVRGVNKKDIKYLVISFSCPVLGEGSWLLFCLLNRRVAKLTSSGVHMAASGNVDLKGYAVEKAGYFIRGFLYEPMHTGHSGLIDMSAFGYLLVLLVVIAILFNKRIVGQIAGRLCSEQCDVRALIDKPEGIKLLIYTVITAAFAYGIIFVGHITIFAAETQYSSSDIMAISMSRYAAPFTIGMLYLIISILKENINNKAGVYVGAALFILCTCEYVTPFNALYNTKTSLEEVKSTREDMTKEATSFIAVISEHKELWGQRVLYLRDDHKAQWVSSAYINLECAPVAVVYGGIANDTMTREEMEYIIDSSHAAYIYSDEIEGNATVLFEGMLDGDFEYNRLYQLSDGRLYAVE